MIESAINTLFRQKAIRTGVQEMTGQPTEGQADSPPGMRKPGGGITHSSWDVAGSCNNWLLEAEAGCTGHSHIFPPSSFGSMNKGRSEREYPRMFSTSLQVEVKNSLSAYLTFQSLFLSYWAISHTHKIKENKMVKKNVKIKFFSGSPAWNSLAFVRREPRGGANTPLYSQRGMASLRHLLTRVHATIKWTLDNP